VAFVDGPGIGAPSLHDRAATRADARASGAARPYLNGNPQDAMRFDPSEAWRTVNGLIQGFIATLPRLLLALVIVATFYVLSKGVRALVRRNAQRQGEHHNLGLAVGRLVQAGTILVGVLVAVTAAFPSFTPADLVGALGIGGVAIGFAFKDIFQNFLAGILILVTKPFVVNDQIIFKEYEGTVEDIQTRATYLKTYDGRRVVIPNAELFTNSVTVNTAFPQRRMEYDIGIGYGDDLEKARAIILTVMQEAEGVAPDPGADVIVVDLDESSVNLRARWWSNSRILDVRIAQDKVLTNVKRALQEAGIDLPYPTRQILLHDQTEATDGDRRAQREGWPAADGEVPEAAGVARALGRLAEARPQPPDPDGRGGEAATGARGGDGRDGRRRPDHGE
jgi:small conductance mechanosensitive channel